LISTFVKNVYGVTETLQHYTYAVAFWLFLYSAFYALSEFVETN